MKSRGWGLAQSFQWVKDQRPQVHLTDAFEHDLLAYEQKLFGPCWPRFRFPPPHPVVLSLYTTYRPWRLGTGRSRVWCSSWLSWTQSASRATRTGSCSLCSGGDPGRAP
uniref:Uncharacterized protein n=1 Tax=Setaria viridis TaxID=4556 RepID=A0A4U6WF58_SETVI|nr:hypothetical protein SEVIR_1G304632v2 [Setaria viridis]